jgi:zinc transport system substrate-binding protein
MTICDYIAEQLTKLDSEHADVFKTNLEEFNGKLAELDGEYKAAVENAKVDTILFGDRFPFRYLTDDYGLKYYAAFVGCSAETEASFETIIFLAGKVDELGLGAICTIENSDQKIANTIKENTKTGDQEILTLNSLQSITSKEVQEGACYYSTMKDNLDVLKKALGE